MSGRRSLRRLLGVIVLCLTGTVAFAADRTELRRARWQGCRRSGRSPARRHRHADRPCRHGRADCRHERTRRLPISRGPVRHIQSHVRAPGLCAARSRRRRRARPADRDGRCGAEGGDAAGNRHSVGSIARRRCGEHEGRRASRSADAADGADVAHDLRIDDRAAGHDDGAAGSRGDERGDVDRHGRRTAPRTTT